MEQRNGHGNQRIKNITKTEASGEVSGWIVEVSENHRSLWDNSSTQKGNRERTKIKTDYWALSFSYYTSPSDTSNMLKQTWQYNWFQRREKSKWSMEPSPDKTSICQGMWSFWTASSNQEEFEKGNRRVKISKKEYKRKAFSEWKCFHKPVISRRQSARQT